MTFKGPTDFIDCELHSLLDPTLAAQIKARVNSIDVLSEMSDLVGQAYSAKPEAQAAILQEAFLRYQAIEIAQRSGLQILLAAHADLAVLSPWGDQSYRHVPGFTLGAAEGDQGGTDRDGGSTKVAGLKAAARPKGGRGKGK